MSKKNTKIVAVSKNTDIQKPNATEAVKLVKKKEQKVIESPKMVNLFKTSYHYYRNFVKEILKDAKVNGFRFVKDGKMGGWKGFISIPSTETEKAKKVLAEFKTKNPDTIDLWW